MLAAVTRRFARAQLVSAGTCRTFASSIASGLGLPQKYGHFIGGEFVEPASGEYFDNVSPIDGSVFIQAARGDKADIDCAVKAANDAYWSTWSKASVTERSNMLLQIADTIEGLSVTTSIDCVPAFLFTTLILKERARFEKSIPSLPLK